MVVKYVDYEGGAGSEDGSSFANRAPSLEHIFGGSSSTGSALSAGDVVRVKATPNPTVLGTGRVSHAPSWPNYNTQQESYSSDVNWSTTEGETDVKAEAFITGDILMIFESTTSSGSRLAEGKNIAGIWQITETSTQHQVKLDGFTASNTNNESGNWRYKALTSECIKLSTTPWKVLASTAGGRAAWTASSNVTTDVNVYWSDWNSNHTWQYPTGSDHINCSSSSGTGKQAYFALGSATDLSGYQQISCLVRYKNATKNASTLSIRLCTDATGDTSVHTIPLHARDCTDTGWMVNVVDLGTNLNSSIQSIALYRDSGTATEEIYIQNIVACKASSSADSITHNSLVGLNTTDDPVWYPVNTLNERGIIHLNVDSRTWRGQHGHGYYGTRGCYFSATNNTATIYKREPLIGKKILDGNLTSNSDMFDRCTWYAPTYGGDFALADSGPLMSCGWNATDMSTQTGHTFLRGNGRGYAFYSGNTNVAIERLHITAFYRGIDLHSEGLWLDDVGASDTYEQGIGISSGKQVRKLNVKYAFGAFGGHSSKGSLQIGGQSNQDFQHASANYQDFNVGWCGGAGNGSLFGFNIYTVHNLHWNKVNALFSGKGFQMRSDVNGCTFEEIRCGASSQNDNIKFDDSNNNNSSNNIFKTVISEGSSLGVYVYSVGSGNVINSFTSKKGSAFGWTHPTLTNQRFKRTWDVSKSIHVRQNLTFEVKGGTIHNRVEVETNATFKSTNLVWDYSGSEFSVYSGGRALNKDFDGVSGAIKNYVGNSNITIEPETTIRKTSSGYALKINGAWNDDIKYDVAQVIVAASSQVTISAWAYREDNLSEGGSNPDWGLSVELRVLANPDLGINSDVVSIIPTGTDYTQAWYNLSCQFTPTAAGVVTVQFRRWSNSGSTDGYAVFDDLSVAQA
tara:strand:+ start:1411 stop:4140 length:2730 start_codon:yes stop_codon:yes gene_type:complete